MRTNKNSMSILRSILRNRKLLPIPSSSAISKTLITSLKQIHTYQILNKNSISISALAYTHFHLHSPQRSFSSSSASASSGPSNIVLIKSVDDFNSAIGKAQDESLPAVFYFTAVWCGPCRFISPIIEKLSEKFPNVTTYKIDIDQEGLGSTLQNLKISAVPTLHFYKGGKKESEIVGADLERLKQTMDRLYQ